jgi:hypothetical protein
MKSFRAATTRAIAAGPRLGAGPIRSRPYAACTLGLSATNPRLSGVRPSRGKRRGGFTTRIIHKRKGATMPDNNTPPVMICRRHELLEQTLERLEHSVQDGFDSVNKTLKEVAKDLREGAVEMATLRIRLALVEKILYGATGTALTGLLLAILALVFKS